MKARTALSLWMMLMLPCLRLPAQQQTMVTIQGTEQSVNGTWDTGTLVLTINGYPTTIQYGQYSSSAGIAAAFGGLLSEDPNSPVNAQAAGNGLILRARLSKGGVISSISFVSNGQQNSFQGSSVNPLLVSSTSVVAMPPEAELGASIWLNSQISPTSATGSVSFYDGSNSIGHQQVNAGHATYSVNNLSVGTHLVTAVYSGDSATAPSTSSPIDVTVSPSSLSSSSASVGYGYDEIGRLTSVIDQNGNAATYSYDTNGNITSIARLTVAQIAILNFSPSSGAAGTIVTITGLNFSSDVSQETVSFAGTAAAIQSGSANQIIVTVPAGIASGPIAVTTPNGSATSTRTFTLSTSASGPPSIASFSPSIVTHGGSVALVGSNFVNQLNLNSVFVNQSVLSVTNIVSPTALQLTVPLVSGSGKITVQTPYGRASSAADLYVLPNPYTPTQVSVNQRIASNTPVNLSIGTAGNIAVFLFDAVAGQQIAVSLTSNTFPGACSSTSIKLFGPSGALVSSSDICYQNDGFLSTLVSDTGTYAIVIPAYNGTGSATLSVSAYKDQHGAIDLDNSIPVSISTAGQTAQYAFRGTADQQVNIALSGLSFSGGCGSATLTVLNPNGSQLSSFTTCNTVPINISELSLPTAGIYTIVISGNGNTGGATLTLSSDQRGSIAVDNAIPVGISLPGQNAKFTFSGTASQQLNFTLSSLSFSGGCGSATLTVLNPNGSLLTSYSTCNTIPIDLASVSLPSTGIYTIVVSAGVNTGGATLTLSADQQNAIQMNNTVPLNISLAGQNADYVFNGTSGDQINILLTNLTFGGSCGSVTMNIRNPDGSQLGSYSSCNSGSIQAPSLGLPATGTYTIIISPGTNTGGGNLQISDQ